jgi:hypothetical protein
MVKIRVPDFHNECSRAEKPGGCRRAGRGYRRPVGQLRGRAVAVLLEDIVNSLRLLDMAFAILAVATWLALAIVAGILAAVKGNSGWAYFFVALLLTPFIGLLAVAMSRDRKAAELDELRAEVYGHRAAVRADSA